MSRFGGAFFAAVACALLAACASAPKPRPIGPPPPPTAAPAAFAALPGWAEDDHLAAFVAFRAGCGVARQPAMAATCARARSMPDPGPREARRFFETNFRLETLAGEGLLTAYFGPVYEARLKRGGAFTAPVRPKPGKPTASPAGDDLSRLLDEAMPPVDLASADRTAIETAPAGGALAWMRPEDLFFMQIQGSGVLVLEDGRRLKASFAAHNGKPFVGIARPMRERGLLADHATSQENIRAWLAARRGPEADAVMRENPRYVFFALQPDDGLEPRGAAGIPMPPGRGIAVDPAHHRYGELYWIAAEAPVLQGAQARYRRLVVALDTGGAIRGQVRADLYLGKGDAAGREAGRVRHQLRMHRLVPVGAGR